MELKVAENSKHFSVDFNQGLPGQFFLKMNSPLLKGKETFLITGIQNEGSHSENLTSS